MVWLVGERLFLFYLQKSVRRITPSGFVLDASGDYFLWSRENVLGSMTSYSPNPNASHHSPPIVGCVFCPFARCCTRNRSKKKKKWGCVNLNRATSRRSLSPFKKNLLWRFLFVVPLFFVSLASYIAIQYSLTNRLVVLVFCCAQECLLSTYVFCVCVFFCIGSHARNTNDSTLYFCNSQ